MDRRVEEDDCLEGCERNFRRVLVVPVVVGLDVVDV